MLKKLFRKLLLEVLNDKNLIDDLRIHTILSKEHPNILYIPVGDMPPAKKRDYIDRLLHKFHESYPDYKIILLEK